MKSNNRVSFVLPVYNAQLNVAQCLDSLLPQKYRAEIILIDDGSTDNTKRILKSYEKQIIIFTNDERKGAAVSRNIGNAAASGEFIAVCDADIYYPERSEIICEFFDTYFDFDVFFSACNIDNNQERYRSPAIEWDFKSKCPVSHPTVAIRKDVSLKFGYHEASIDTDLYEFYLLDIAKAGHRFGWSSNCTVLKMEAGRKRDKEKADKLKAEWYKKYFAEGIA